MNMIKLYGRGQSRSFRGVWALLECGLEFEYIHVDPANLETGYAELNSQTKVPTMTDGDLVLIESAAIVNYAGVKSGQYIPKDLAGCAAYDNFCYFIMTDLEQPLWTIGKHKMLLPEEYRHEPMLKTAVYEFEKSQNALMTLWQSKPFALGDEFTLVDVLLGQTVNWAERFGMQVNSELLEYRDRLYQRPAAQEALGMIEA